MTDFYTYFDFVVKTLYHKIMRENEKVITKVEFRIQNVKLGYKTGISAYIRPNYLVIIQILTFFLLILHKRILRKMQ